jgi:hypothetical protein
VGAAIYIRLPGEGEQIFYTGVLQLSVAFSEKHSQTPAAISRTKLPSTPNKEKVTFDTVTESYLTVELNITSDPLHGGFTRDMAPHHINTQYRNMAASTIFILKICFSQSAIH